MIPDEVRESAVFLFILSPGYINSDWCKREYEGFIANASVNGGVRIGYHSRLFKVIQRSIDSNTQPIELMDVTGYTFFEETEQGNPIPIELNVRSNPSRTYLSNLSDLSYDISKIVQKKISKHSEEGETLEECIYLAETTNDLKAEREKISRELLQHGFSVFPDEYIALHESNYKTKVQQYLSKCQLSVHLVGENYSIVPEGATQSTVEIQLNEAKSKEIDRLIWLPSGLDYSIMNDSRQSHFIERLLNTDPGDAAISRDTLETFKTLILDSINEIKRRKYTVVGQGQGQEHLTYLIFGHEDESAAIPVYDYLFDHNTIAVERSYFTEGSHKESSIQDHIGNLIECDSVLIFHGNAPFSFLRAKIRELRKLKGYGRNNPLEARVVYMSRPESHEKETYKSNLVDHIIKWFKPFDPISMKDFEALILMDSEE